MFGSEMILTSIKVCVEHVHTFESFGNFGVAPVGAKAWPFEYGEDISEVIVNAFEIFP